MNNKHELIDMIYVILWHCFVVLMVIGVMSFLTKGL